VLEEGNAQRMLAELVRVTKPSGRIAVMVRALDIPWVINVPLRHELKRKRKSRTDSLPQRVVPIAVHTDVFTRQD
jgi:hypothetical protein